MSSVASVTHWGNHSFLRIRTDCNNVGNEGFDNVGLNILKALNEFKLEHPNLRVTDWKPQITVVSGASGDFFEYCGLWIDHEPKKNKETDKDPLNRGPVFGELDNALGQD